MQSLVLYYSSSKFLPFIWHIRLLIETLEYRHVVDRKIPIDVRVLCNFVDKLCGSIVVANSLDRNSTLHGVALPRSWFFNTVHHLARLGHQNLRLAWLYLQPLTSLLQRICSGSDAGTSLAS